MRPPLDGTVLVTGASSGIGEAMARQLAPRAGTLVLLARRADRLNALRDALVAQRPDLRVVVAPCDLLDRAETVRILTEVEQEVGAIDVLINNAGFGDYGMYDQVSWEKTERMIRLNVEVLSFLTHRLLPGMAERRRGGILNVSSGFGLTFMPGFAAYVGTKHYVTGFTECLRLELRDHGVVVTQVCPGPVATEFQGEAGLEGAVAPPGFVTIDADTCARAALRGFERDRALVVPGALMRVLMFLGRLTPRFLMRWGNALLAKRLRALSAGS